MKKKFEEHFIGKNNVIYGRAKFNQWRQLPNETPQDFITDLISMAENLGYGDNKDDLICDRIIAGVLDWGLSERLMPTENLTLDKAIEMARLSHAVKK